MSAPKDHSFGVGLVTSLLFSTAVKWCIGLNGKGHPPMYGDFEAQRHWLEITFHLPVSQWYHYDLLYWGLDYPPLTAYHSYILGWIAHIVNPKWVALDASRGYEGDDLKTFMRTTALVTDLIIFGTGSIPNPLLRNLTILTELIVFFLIAQPGLAIIDHGHFQYNAAMLGFSLWAFGLFLRKRYALGSIMFCLSLSFKQMALYYSLPVFFFLLGQCRFKGFTLLIKLGVSVIITLGVCFLPFLGSVADIQQVVHRMFPFQRGLYEDKVANVWCALSVLVKLRNLFDLERLASISVIATLVAKSILIPSLPLTLLMLDEPFATTLFHNVAMFSMYPLLKKDDLVIPVVAVTLMYNAIASPALRPTSLLTVVNIAFITASTTLISAEFLIPAPQRYPDIYIVLNVLLSCAMFFLLFIYFNLRQFGVWKTALGVTSPEPSTRKKEKTR
ncbi:ALG6, ALG8 glycosyltransferase family-domain-containing protein [Chytridium lagenaria]|nr:ALG6, ALG8 glycosyltransferase family-domain-containing protein [Chytridium lagenaria]